MPSPQTVTRLDAAFPFLEGNPVPVPCRGQVSESNTAPMRGFRISASASGC